MSWKRKVAFIFAYIRIYTLIVLKWLKRYFYSDMRIVRFDTIYQACLLSVRKEQVVKVYSFKARQDSVLL